MSPNGTLSVDERVCILCGAKARPLQKEVPMYALKCGYMVLETFADLSRREVFIMSKIEKGVWEKLLIPERLVKKSSSQQIAYISVMTAFCVVANMFFEFKLAETQFSLTLFVSALTGILIGPIFGFVACFMGDLVGFLYNSAGFAYMPWIGISMGIAAIIAGLIVNFWRGEKAWFLYVKLALVCLLTFTVCTVLINTTAFWLLSSKVDYGTYLISRLFVQGQIWNSVVNYVLLFIAVPVLSKIKPLQLHRS